jgi:hypothetical protein
MKKFLCVMVMCVGMSALAPVADAGTIRPNPKPTCLPSGGNGPDCCPTPDDPYCGLDAQPRITVDELTHSRMLRVGR